MGSALISPDKPPSLPEKLRKKSLSNTISIPTQEQHTVQNIDSTIHQDQVNEIDTDEDEDYYFDDEEDEETQWSFERRTAASRDTKIATEEFLAACEDLKVGISKEVDNLFNKLPDAYDPKFETKYKMIQRQLQKLFPKKSK